MKEQYTGHENYTAHIPEVKPLSKEAKAVLMYYQETIAIPHVINIGSVTQLTPRYEGDEAPGALREYKVEFPPSLNQAYALLAQKHDDALMLVAKRHAEWKTDYQYAPQSLAFQIDGPAYPDQFLAYAANISPDVLAEFLQGRIYEVENNIAGYDLNGRLWPDGTTNKTWHETLEKVRQQTGKKVAVLASTNEKFDALLLSELGKDTLPSEKETRTRTGFDTFMGPNELIAQYKKYDGQNSDYVFFGRTSYPTQWLEDPTTSVHEPFLANPILRQFVRAYAITHNFDNPEHDLYDPRVITDTKAALCLIGAAHLVNTSEDIYSQKFLAFLNEKNIGPDKVVFLNELTPGKIKKLGKNLERYLFNYPRSAMLVPQLLTHLEGRGVDPNLVANGSQLFRAKPLRRHYGAWGHIRGVIHGATFVSKLMKDSEIRGPFVIQPELQNFQIIDKNTAIEYLVIDRVFFVRAPDGELKRMEGIRTHMPKNSPEGQKNAVHDGKFTLDAPIVA